MTKKDLLNKWRKKIEGIRYEPPIDYRLIFNETVKNCAKKIYSLLDIGTGTGKVIFENKLEELYRKVVGIDILPEMIKICQEKAKTNGMRNAEFYVMDSMKKMNFKDKSFNVVTAMFSPYEPKEVARLLKGGGYFILLWGLKGDHKEITNLFPEIFDLWEGKLYFENFEERKKRLNNVGLEIIGHNTLQYRWIFRNEKTLKEFYQKVLLTDIFKSKEERLKKLRKDYNGEIPITRIMGTTIAKKI